MESIKALYNRIPTATSVLGRFFTSCSDEPVPYTNFNHPETSKTDKMYSFLEYCLGGRSLEKKWLCQSARSTNEEGLKVIQEVRDVVQKECTGLYTKGMNAWDKLIKDISPSDSLVTGTLSVPRNSQILTEWGLVNEDKLSLLSEPQDKGAFVKVEFLCPASALKEVQDSTQNASFVESAEFVLYFHGGGTVMGSPRAESSMFGVGLFRALVNAREDGSAVPPLVFLSPAYRLAPNNPFPAGVIDGLSVTSFLMNQYDSSALNISGISGGGLVSTVVGFETLRRYPDRVKSLVFLTPMVDPKANSNSYFMNSKSSLSTSVNMLYWCWAAYLQIERESDVEDFRSSDALSNYTKALESSQWSKYVAGEDKSLPWRLVFPQSDLPSALLCSDTAPKVIVVSATADPLEDECKSFFDEVRKASGKNRDQVQHLSMKGSHEYSWNCDKEGLKAVHKAWAQAIMNN